MLFRSRRQGSCLEFLSELLPPDPARADTSPPAGAGPRIATGVSREEGRVENPPAEPRASENPLPAFASWPQAVPRGFGARTDSNWEQRPAPGAGKTVVGIAPPAPRESPAWREWLLWVGIALASGVLGHFLLR